MSTGAVIITAAGGSPGYTFTWSPGVSTTDSAIGLTAGNYSITINDTHNCTLVQTATIGEPGVLSLSAVASNVICNGGNTGSIISTASGGSPSYSFTASNGVNSYNSVSGQFNALQAGGY